MSESPITVLITDMEGSTALTAIRGDAEAMNLLRVHESLVRDVVAKYGGREIKSMGDGFMITFQSPEGAIACSLDIQDALNSYNDSHPEDPIRVRMGLNSGPVIEESGDIYGTTVNAATRIAAKAQSGQLLVSESVRDGNGDAGDWTFVDRGLFWLKGLRERWALYEATRRPELVRPTAPDGRTPFIDREDERASLRLYVDAALEGRGGLVLLAGESGTGKTRLAEELGAEATGRGMRLLVGRCYEATQNHPFAPFVSLLESVERSESPESFRLILGEAAPEIVRLLPHIRRRYADIPPPADLPDPDLSRRFLFSSVRDVLAGMSREHPLFLLLDDLQWADEQSLLLLEQLAGELATTPILVVGTYIPAEPGSSRLLSAMIASLHRRRLIERFQIGALAEADLAALLGALAGREPPPDVVRLLHRETEGNVFFAEEVARQLIEQRAMFDADGRWRTDLEGLDLEVPETIRLTIGRRLDNLAEGTRHVLTIAAVIGRAFGFDLLDELGDTDQDDLIDALDDAERARLIASSSEGGAVQFRFSHELIRQTLVGEVSLTRRQLLHKRIADAMEGLYESSLSDHAAEIAYHLEGAGRRADPPRTRRFLVIAGERALEASAHDDAQRHFDRALTLLAPDDLGLRAQILEKLGTAQRALGNRDEAIATWQEALAASEAAGDPIAVAQMCLDIGLQVLWWRQARDVVELVDRGLRALRDRPTAIRGGLLAIGGTAASQGGDYEKANELLASALSIARDHDDERILGLALYSRAVHHFNHSEYREAAALGRESEKHLRRTSDLWSLAQVLGYVSASYTWLGSFEEAAASGAEAETLGLKIGNWAAWVFGQRGRTMLDFKRNPDFGWYEEDGRSAVELGRQQGFGWLSALGHTRMGLASFWTGRWNEALLRFEEAVRVDARGPAAGYSAPLFLTHAYLGNRTESLELIASLRHQFAQPGRPNPITSWVYTLSAIEALAMLGESNEVASLYPVALDCLASGTVARGLDYRLTATLAGIAAGCAHDWQNAERHFEQALQFAQESNIRIEAPDARRFYAQMLVDRNGHGDRDRARTLLHEAAGLYRRIGMSRHEELARSMLAQIA